MILRESVVNIGSPTDYKHSVNVRVGVMFLCEYVENIFQKFLDTLNFLAFLNYFQILWLIFQ